MRVHYNNDRDAFMTGKLVYIHLTSKCTERIGLFKILLVLLIVNATDLEYCELKDKHDA